MGDVDIRPDHTYEVSGLIDDFDGVITDVRFIMTDYGGKSKEAVPACLVTWDVSGEETSELLSVGGAKDFVPDETGRGLNKVGAKASLIRQKGKPPCKYLMFLDSLVETGFPLNKLVEKTGDNFSIEPIIGLDAHYLRKAVSYSGIKKEGDRENTIPLCTKIHKLPWENEAKGKGKSVGAGAVKGKVPDAGLADTVARIIQGIIIENDGGVAKKNLLSALFKHDDVKALSDKKEALKLAADDSFLKSRDEWAYEDGMLRLG